MIDREIVQRLRALGLELPPSLDSSEAEPPVSAPVDKKFTILGRFPTLNSVMLPLFFTMLGSLIVGGYVWLRYDENYFFGDYQKAAVSEELSNNYVEFGNTLMLTGGYRAAEANYQRALELDPNNQDAVTGLMKAQVMLPEEGEQLLQVDVVFSKIDYLLSRDRERGGKDAELYFMKGSALSSMGNTAEAEAAYQAGIGVNSDYVGNHMGLALLYAQSDPEKSIEHGLQAIDLMQRSEGPELAYPYNIVGLAYLLTGDWTEARHYFNDASKRSSEAGTLYFLALATRYTGASDEAMRVHERALSMALQFDPQFLASDPASQSQWMLYYLPQDAADRESTMETIPISAPALKLALLRYEYGIDAALSGDLQAASQQFDLAAQLDSQGVLEALIANRLLSAQYFLQPDEAISQWLEEQAGGDAT